MAFFVLPLFSSKVSVGNVMVIPSDIAANKYFGAGSISGLVRENGTPVRRRVNLHARPVGTLVATVWSKSNGYYTFRGISKKHKYYVVSIDESGGITQYPAQVQDLLTGDYDEINQG